MTGTAREDCYHHGDLRNALLDAAESRLDERGAEGLSLRALARAIGVSHAAPYRHFSDRRALLAALAARGIERLQARVEAAIAAVPHGAEQQLTAAGIAYVRLALESPRLFEIIFSGRRSPGAARALISCWERIMAAGVAAGVFRQRGARELAWIAWTAVHGIAAQQAAGRLATASGIPAAPEQQVELITKHVLYGIAR